MIERVLPPTQHPSGGEEESLLVTWAQVKALGVGGAGIWRRRPLPQAP